MQTLTIELGARSYPILIGERLFDRPDALAGALGARSLIVTSKAVAAHHLPALRAALGEHPHADIVLPDGEPAKTLETVACILDAALAAGLGRDGSIIALGGGAVGDVAGLAAALYQRGIAHIQIPTTLLAQVDSSVGGKTAVNFGGTKNLVGAFHQPSRVLADVGFLATLPERDYKSGLAEVIKYAVLDPSDLFAWLEQHIDALVGRDTEVLIETVARCCAIKAAIVAADETEQGRRAVLNLGHTFGHALESHYEGELLHGEAVALGSVMAVRMSQSLGWLDAGDAARIVTLIRAAGLPTRLPTPLPDADRLLAWMARDKKAAAGHIRLVLVRGIGKVELTGEYPQAALLLTLRDFTSAAM